MAIHARLDAVGEVYDVPALKDQVSDRFESMMRSGYLEINYGPSFGEVADLAYALTPPQDRRLREKVLRFTRLIVKQKVDADSKLEEAIRRNPDFGRDIAIVYVESPSWEGSHWILHRGGLCHEGRAVDPWTSQSLFSHI